MREAHLTLLIMAGTAAALFYLNFTPDKGNTVDSKTQYQEAIEGKERGDQLKLRTRTVMVEEVDRDLASVPDPAGDLFAFRPNNVKDRGIVEHQGRRLIATDQTWLRSDRCELGTDSESCALELANKYQLRRGPVDVPLLAQQEPFSTAFNAEQFVWGVDRLGRDLRELMPDQDAPVAQLVASTAGSSAQYQEQFERRWQSVFEAPTLPIGIGAAMTPHELVSAELKADKLVWGGDHFGRDLRELMPGQDAPVAQSSDGESSSSIGASSGTADQN